MDGAVRTEAGGARQDGRPAGNALTFAIVIASHGDARWEHLARTRALPSAESQGAEEVLIEHHPKQTRAEVRNRLTLQASSDWIITLDADDELTPGYVQAMRDAVSEQPALLTPRVAYVRENGSVRGRVRFWPEVPLREGNWMVVGTAFPKSLWWQVGGWRSFTGTGQLNEFDDWDMWIRLTRAGAEIVRVDGAVYRAFISTRTSAHRNAKPQQRLAWHKEIEQANWPKEV